MPVRSKLAFLRSDPMSEIGWRSKATLQVILPLVLACDGPDRPFTQRGPLPALDGHRPDQSAEIFGEDALARVPAMHGIKQRGYARGGPHRQVCQAQQSTAPMTRAAEPSKHR